jgi:hypothetical protein
MSLAESFWVKAGVMLLLIVSVTVAAGTLTSSEAPVAAVVNVDSPEWLETYIRFHKHLGIDSLDWKVWEEYLEFLAESRQEERLMQAGSEFLGLMLGKGQGYLPPVDILEKLSRVFSGPEYALEREALAILLPRTVPPAEGKPGLRSLTMSLDLRAFRREVGDALIRCFFGENFVRASKHAEWLDLTGPVAEPVRLFQARIRAMKIQEEDFLALGWIFSQKDFPQFEEARKRFLKAYPRTEMADLLRQPYFDVLDTHSGSLILQEAIQRVSADFRTRLPTSREPGNAHEHLLGLRRLVFWGLATSAEKAALAALDLQVRRSQPAPESLVHQVESLFRSKLYPEALAFLDRNPELWDAPGWTGRLAEIKLMSGYFTGHLKKAELRQWAGDTLLIVPESFWVAFFHLDRALRDNDFLVAEYWFLRAQRFHPVHDMLVMPGRALFVWRHRWRILPAAFFLLYLLTRIIMWFVITLWQRTFWTRMSLVESIRPRLALQLLERRIGMFSETSESVVLFEHLARCAQKCGEMKKAERYADILLTYRPGNPNHQRTLTDVVISRAQTGNLHAVEKCLKLAQNPTDTVAMSKMIHSLLARKAISRDLFPILKRYVALCPEDQVAVEAFFEVFRNSPLDMIPFDDIKLLERLWEKNPEKAYGWLVWRIWMIRGEKGQARRLLEDFQAKGVEGPIRELFDQLERASEKIFQEVRTGLRSGDNGMILNSFDRLSRVKYWSPLQQQVLMKAVETVSFGDDPKVVQARQKALFTLKMGVPEWATFFQWVDLNFTLKLES